jgi:creatinine amidohydrolase
MQLSLEKLTSPNVKALLADGIETAVLPVGSVEQHGRHGPLGTDSLTAEAVAKGVAERLRALCLPPVWFGVSPHHMDFAGSITVRPEVLSQLIEDILSSLVHHGIQKILIVNGHGGNTAAISTACLRVRERFPKVFVAQSSAWLVLHDVYDELPAELRQDSWRSMVAHGGLFETSVVMALDEGLVDLDQARSYTVERFMQAGDPALSVTAKINELTPHGSAGDPASANREAGRLFLEKTVERLAVKWDAALKTFCTGAGL